MSETQTAGTQSPLVEQARTGGHTRWIVQITAVLAATVELAVPLAIAFGVAKAIEGDPIGPGTWAPMIAAILGSGAFAACQVLLLSRIAASEMGRLRLAVATRLIQLMPRAVEKLGVGEASALYSHYANELEPLLSADRVRRRTAIITVCGCLALMIGFDWRLTVALAAALLVIGLVIAAVLNPVKKRASQGLHALAETAADLGEYLRSIRSATVYGLGPGYLYRIETRLSDVAIAERRIGHAQALVDLIVKTTSMLLLISLGALGMYRVSTGSLSAPDLSGFLGALAILLAPAAKYTEMLQHVHTAKAAESRLKELPGEVHPLPSVDPRSASISQITPIQFSEAVLDPADGIVVGQISFSARPGEIICLVGPSGSGKTTTLSAIAGFTPLASGEIRIGGHAQNEWAAERLWRAIGYVEQGTPTLGSTVRTFLTPDESRLPEETSLRELISALGLDSRLGEKGIDTALERGGTSLSGGERQRLAIVRALASDRPLLLFDEPTAHLDAETEEAVIDAISRSLRGRILIVATHSERLIRRAHQVIHLDPGGNKRKLDGFPPNDLHAIGSTT